MRLDNSSRIFIGVDDMGQWQTIMGKRIYIGDESQTTKHVIPKSDESRVLGGNNAQRKSEISDLTNSLDLIKEANRSFSTFTNKKGRRKRK